MSSLPPTRASEESAAREPPTPPPGWSAATLDGSPDDAASAPADLTDDALRVDGGARYQSVTLLGVGGMGEVVLVRDGRIGRHVARKTLRAKNLSPDARPRFLREAQVQARLDHPSVVPVYDLGLGDDRQPWFTMKRVRGLTLAEVLEGHARGDVAVIARHSQRRLLAALVSVCLAVDYAHARGVLHRDLKPSNVMLGDFGEAYVLDWGLARVDRPEAEAPVDPSLVAAPATAATPALTAAGAVVGTPLYMAPEQLAGRAELLDARTDVFALGAIVFEVATLARLRQSATDVYTGVTRRVRDLLPDAPPELDAICARATARLPDDRFPSARSLAEALEAYLDGDRNEALRRELAVKHVENAERLLAASGADDRLEALREAMRAMAFDPENRDAQRLLLEAVTGVPEAVPPEAREEYARSIGERRRELMGVLGPIWLTWLVAIPAAAAVGARDWRPLAVGNLATLVGAAIAWRSARRGVTSTARTMLLAALASVTVLTATSYLGPFVMPPLCGVTVAVVCALYATPNERRAVTAVLALTILGAFGVELLGVVEPAWRFHDGQLTLFPRAVHLPERPTILGLLYMSVSFVVAPAILVGRMRDAAARLEQRQFLQAWQIRRLFPGAKADP